jgi:hypothetical protein
LERIQRGKLQYFLQIQIQITRICAQSLLGGGLAQPLRLQISNDLLPEFAGYPV